MRNAAWAASCQNGSADCNAYTAKMVDYADRVRIWTQYSKRVSSCLPRQRLRTSRTKGEAASMSRAYSAVRREKKSNSKNKSNRNKYSCESRTNHEADHRKLTSIPNHPSDRKRFRNAVQAATNYRVALVRFCCLPRSAPASYSMIERMPMFTLGTPRSLLYIPWRFRHVLTLCLPLPLRALVSTRLWPIPR
jgi:hypothetical protein